MSLYVNGTLITPVSSKIPNGIILTTYNYCHVGLSDSDNYLDGYIGDVRIDNKELSSDEVFGLYQRRLVDNLTDLVPFNVPPY